MPLLLPLILGWDETAGSVDQNNKDGDGDGNDDEEKDNNDNDDWDGWR